MRNLRLWEDKTWCPLTEARTYPFAHYAGRAEAMGFGGKCCVKARHTRQ